MEERDSDPPAGDPSVPAILRASSPRAVLAALLADDTLELEERCAARLRDQALLIPHERLYLRTAARVAHAATCYRGHPPLDVWIAKRLSIAVRELLDEDREWARDMVGRAAEASRFYASFAELLGMEPELLRRGLVRFHALPYDVRRVFYDLVVEGKPYSEVVAAERDQHPEPVERRLERAAEALGIEPQDLQGRSGGEDDGL